jgi:hypothetical protein
MPIYLGNQEIGKEYVDSFELNWVFRGNNPIGLVPQYNNWLPVSQSKITGYFDTNYNGMGSYDNAGNWYRITGSSTAYSTTLAKTGTQKTFIYSSPNYVQSNYSPNTSSYLGWDNNLGSGNMLLQFWIKPSTIASGNNYIYRRDISSNNINLYFDKDLNYIYWGVNTRPTPRSYKLVSSSIDPDLWNNTWHNVAFHFQNDPSDSITRRLYVDGVLQQSWNIGETNNLVFSQNNVFLGDNTGSAAMSCESIVCYDDINLGEYTVNQLGDIVLANYSASMHLF